MSRRIAAHFGSMAAIRAADADTLAGVDGIGAEKARVITAELTELAPLLDKLQAQQVGIQVTEPQHKPTADASDASGGEATAAGSAAVLAGQAVVVTGSMSGPLAALSRNEMNELIERAAWKGIVIGVQAHHPAGRGREGRLKRAKAEELGIRILDPEEFAALIADHLPAS